MQVTTNPTSEQAATALAARPRMRWIADVAILGIAAVWGGTFFMIKDVTSGFPILAFLVIRFICGIIVLTPFAMRLKRWPTRQEWLWGGLAGVTLCLGYIFQTFSMRLIDSGRTGFITGLYVVLVPLLALIFLRQRIVLRVLLGMVLAFVGLTLLSYSPGGSAIGDGLAFMGALTFAGQIVAVERFPRNADWALMSIIQVIMVAIISAILLPLLAAAQACDSSLCAVLKPISDPLPTSIPVEILLVAAFTGIVATGVGLALQAWAQRFIPPGDAALIYAMESPFSAVFGAAFRGEVLPASALVGCGLILSGMLTTALGNSGTAHGSAARIGDSEPSRRANDRSG